MPGSGLNFNFSTSSGSSKPVTLDLINTFQKDKFKDFTRGQYSRSNQGKGEGKLYKKGQGAPKLRGIQRKSLRGLSEMLDNINQGTGQEGEALNTGFGAFNDIAAGPGSEEFENFFRTNIQDPAMRDFERDTAPMISRQSAALGAIGGSDQQKMGSRAVEDFQRIMEEQRSALALQGRQQQLEAMNFLPSLLEARGDAGITAFGAGEVGRQGLQDRVKLLDDIEARKMDRLASLLTTHTRGIGQESKQKSKSGGGGLFGGI